jgi:hypothetical protein
MSAKEPDGEEAGLTRARAAKSKALELFDSLVGGAAVGLTRQRSGAYSLKVNLTEPPAANITLPTEIDGVPIKIEVVGPIRKRST